ncbi:MAG TPA: ABC transporter ATP-binding protein [Clostridia bacterium]|jgi:ATP-binding cassette subfamily B protein|nr:ABC transporter ATP-binding protein [Clostridia bacterium]HQA98321.1 ABC transporter ATP-binding protein [Clostridia bacterium]HUM61403.1 ABC transporter ATP-binding protein [Clostridia bacterium]
MNSTRRILGLLKPYRGKVLLGFLFQTVVIVTRLIQPLITRQVVNDVIIAGRHQLLVQLCLTLLGLSLTRAVSSYVRVQMMERASQNVAYDLRTGLFRHLQTMSFSFYDRNRVGEIMSRMTGDLEGVRDYLAGGIITMFEQGITFFGALVFMFTLSWQATLTILAMLPLIAWIAFRFRSRIRPAFREAREQTATLNTRVQENLAGIHVVKAFVREQYERELFEQENRKLLGVNLKITDIWRTYVPIMHGLSEICTPLVLATGSVLIATGHMDIGTLVGVTGYIWMLTQPMRMLSQIINSMTRASTSAEKIFYYLDLGPSIRDDENPQTVSERKGRVEFDRVAFSYDQQPVLQDISFVAEPGQTIAIMGATGAGKTSLVRLLSRSYDVISGRVLVDGVDVRKQRLKELRCGIGYVPQETFLFSESLFENIRFGRPDASLDAVVAAARAAQAEEFIEEMPLKYETVVGERGVGLSGGQKQRTAIARALLIDPSILVLDDATSAVDMQTEYLIQQHLERSIQGRTTFIIAHRMSSVKNADLILVLNQGRIAERGSHQELMALKGEYWQMWQDQLTSISGEGGGV